MTQAMLQHDGREMSLDEYGHLVNRCDWDRGVAQALAQLDEVELNDQHWLVLDLLRSYYDDYAMEPPMRWLLKQLRERTGQEKFSSRDMYRLFKEGPARQGSRYAGLPIPVSCI